MLGLLPPLLSIRDITMSRLLLIFATILSFSRTASAQVVHTPEGEVEFIGLERWTVSMIRDTMAVRAPGAPLGQRSVVLRQVGFVSASVLSLEGADGRLRRVVTVVEPHRAAHIRQRTLSGDSLPNAPAWADGIALFKEQNLAFQSAIQKRGTSLLQDSAALSKLRSSLEDDLDGVEAFWRFLDQHRSPADLELALHTLATDRNGTNAAIAAAILTNFPQEPRAWRALLDAMRDSRVHVAATASQATRGLLGAGERVVDWQPAASSIRALLDGTNVFVLENVLAALTETRISPDLAPVLLGDGGAELVLARLGATHIGTRRVAHAFLIQISGTDFGEDPVAWREWLRSVAHAPQA